MKTNIYLLSILSIVLCLFSSCSDSDDNDTTKPTINLVYPTEGAVLKIGADIHFDAVFEDNEALASYKVDIHNNFNDHGHQSVLSARNETVAFTFNKSWSDIKGQKQAKVHHHEIVIPENATPGKYHLMVYCLDAEGNESYIVRNIELSYDGEDPSEHH